MGIANTKLPHRAIMFYTYSYHTISMFLSFQYDVILVLLNQTQTFHKKEK